MKKSILALGVLVLTLACAQVNYVGQTYEPTKEVEIFFDDKLIEKEYTIIGQAIGTGSFGASNSKIQRKLIQEAKKRGADAILITGLGKDNISTGDGTSMEETQINAM